MHQDATTTLAWYQSYPVQRTLELIGEPDGTDEWIATFTATLFEVVEQIAETKQRLKVDRFLELRSQWDIAVAHVGWSRGGQLPTYLLREMVDLLPIDKVADSLRTTVEQVEKWLFPKTDLDVVRTAADKVREGHPATLVAKAHDIDYCDVLAPYLRYHRIETVTVAADGRRRMPPSVRERILELKAEGLGPKAITEQINDELGVGVKYDAVKQVVRRAA